MLKFVVTTLILLGSGAWAESAPKELLGTWGTKLDDGADWSYTFSEKTVTFTAVCGDSHSEVTVSVEYVAGGFVPAGSVADPSYVGSNSSSCEAKIGAGQSNYSIDGNRITFYDPESDLSSPNWIRRP